ncbi:hypothetical protein JCM6882_009329 [Rhodosporidiobolus microsporus]
MSGYNDPYRYPRDDWRPNDFNRGQYGQNDDRGARGERDQYGGGYGGRDERNWHDDRGGGYGGGGRPRPRWEEDERDFKRGRYEDYGHGRGDAHSPYPPPHAGYPPQQHQQPYPVHQAQPDYSQPTYPPQPPAAASAAPATGRKPPPVQPEAASASVILLGLPAHVTDVHLRQFLEDMGASIDSTTVIMDRATGISKRFGFAKFSSVEHARAFIEPNFPSIPWKERHGPGPDDGMRVKINYSQKSGGWREDQGASARLTEDQRKAEGSSSQGFYVNDGTRDIGSTPSQILLLRGLDPLSGEEDIVAALSRVGGRANQEIAKGGIKKVYIAKDRASRSSWGFAFVRFADVRLATDVLAAVFNPRFHPSGFRVRTSIVAASFSHENSFIPVYAASPWAFASDGGQQLAYWDDKGFVQPWTPPPANPAEAMRNVPKAPRAVEEAKVDADMDAFFASIGEEPPAEGAALPSANATTAAAAASAAPAIVASPASAVPTTQPSTESSAVPPAPTLPPPGSVAPISIKPITALPGSAAAASPAKAESAKPTVSAAPAPAAVPPTAAATPLGGKEKKSDLIISRKAAGSIAKWNTKAKELRTTPTTAPAPSASGAAQGAPQPQQPSAVATKTPPAVPAAGAPAVAYDDPEFEHGDPTNLTNSEMVATAATRKAASIKKHAAAAAAASSSAAEASAKPKYVDRAAARREALGQSDLPDPHGGKGKKRFDAPQAEAAVEAPSQNTLEDEENAGRKLLEKMGWSAGTGLGASGDGRVAPVQAAQFQKGAGLGATKGVAVGEEKKLTYTESLREKALERYNAS